MIFLLILRFLQSVYIGIIEVVSPNSDEETFDQRVQLLQSLRVGEELSFESAPTHLSFGEAANPYSGDPGSTTFATPLGVNAAPTVVRCIRENLERALRLERVPYTSLFPLREKQTRYEFQLFFFLRKCRLFSSPSRER